MEMILSLLLTAAVLVSADLSGSKRAPEVGGHYDRDNFGRNNAGLKASHSWNNGNTKVGGFVDHNWGGGRRKDTSFGVGFSHRWRRDFHENVKRQKVGGYANTDSNGRNNAGFGASHSWNDGNTKVGGHLDHSWGGRGGKHTNGGFSLSHKKVGGHYNRDSFGRNNAGLDVSHSWNHGNTKLGGYVDHSWGGGGRKDTSAGFRLTHRFGRALHPAMRPDSGTNVHHTADQTRSSSCLDQVSHTWNDGRTKTEAHVKKDSNGGKSSGWSFSHKWRRDLDTTRRVPAEDDEPEEENSTE